MRDFIIAAAIATLGSGTFAAQVNLFCEPDPQFKSPMLEVAFDEQGKVDVLSAPPSEGRTVQHYQGYVNERYVLWNLTGTFVLLRIDRRLGELRMMRVIPDAEQKFEDMGRLGQCRKADAQKF